MLDKNSKSKLKLEKFNFKKIILITSVISDKLKFIGSRKHKINLPRKMKYLKIMMIQLTSKRSITFSKTLKTAKTYLWLSIIICF